MIDRQAVVSARAILPLEGRFKSTAAEAAGVVGFKSHNLLHQEDKGLRK